MLVDVKLQRFSGAVFRALFIILVFLAAFIPSPGTAQTGEPIKIGYSMALTGGLAPNGKSALLAQKLWEEDVNVRGGLLGRPVKLIYYDDQTNPATIPGIFGRFLTIGALELLYASGLGLFASVWRM
jgi:branched-chain amino acid transport system substrate-binding protein